MRTTAAVAAGAAVRLAEWLPLLALRAPSCPDCHCPPVSCALSCHGPASTGAIAQGEQGFGWTAVLLVVAGAVLEAVLWEAALRRLRRPPCLLKEDDGRGSSSDTPPEIMAARARARAIQG